MKSILIDIDDVICESVYFEVMNKITGANKKIEECNTPKMEDNFDATHKQLTEYYKQICSGKVYQNAQLKPDCKKVIEKLSKKYEIYICSVVVISGNREESGNLFVDKFDFLCKNFPFLDPNNFIFTSNKNIFRADIIIDDKASNLEGDNKKTKLLFTAYHNKNMTEEKLKKQGLIRVNNWKEVEKILL